MRLSWYFWQKLVLRWLLKYENLGSHSFSCQSLLLSITVINYYASQNMPKPCKYTSECVSFAYASILSYSCVGNYMCKQ